MTTDTHQKVVWFDVSVYKVFTMYIFDPADHLISQHENCLDGEPSRAKSEQIFQRRTQQFHHKDIPISFLPIPDKNLSIFPSKISKTHSSFTEFDKLPAHVRYSDTTLQNLVEFWLVQKLRMASPDALHFDCDFLYLIKTLGFFHSSTWTRNNV